MTRRLAIGRVPTGDFPDKEWAHWAQDFEVVHRALADLSTKRQIHKAHREVLYEHEDVEGREIKDGTVTVHHWMQENYADSMLIGLRRIVDKTGRSFSFVKLLERLERKRPLITFKSYVRLWNAEEHSSDQSFPKMLFSRFSSDGRTLDRKRIRADIDTLLADHEALLKYINNAIAHHADKSRTALATGPSPNLTWEDLDRLFDDITALFNKYYALVKPGVAIDFRSVLPAGYDEAFLRMVRVHGD